MSEKADKGKRYLSNWLESFLEWTMPRSEAPKSMLTWSGLFALASVTKRRVKWPMSLLGTYEIDPHLYVLFVGPPGAVKKSTTVGYATKLLRQIPTVTMASQESSASYLVNELAQSPDGSLCLVVGEMADLIRTGGDDMYDLLTSLYDGVPYKRGTHKHGVEEIPNPCLNFLACTTPGWVARNPSYIIEGGFASRVVFVFEMRPRQRRMYYDIRDISDFKRLEVDLIRDLKAVARLKGEFKHESLGLRAEMEAWYQTQSRKAEAGNYEHLEARRHVHLHKVCGLLSLAERSDLVVTTEHFHQARKLLEASYERVPRAMASAGRNPQSALAFEIVDFLEARGQATGASLAKRFYQQISVPELTQTLRSLEILGEIEALDRASIEFPKRRFRKKVLRDEES